MIAFGAGIVLASLLWSLVMYAKEHGEIDLPRTMLLVTATLILAITVSAWEVSRAIRSRRP